MNGAVALHSCTSSSSSGSTSSTFWVQELLTWVSGSSPPASTAVPARCASRLAWPADRAIDVIDAAERCARTRAASCSLSPSWWATFCSRRVPSRLAGWASLIRSNVTSSGSATPAGRGADSPSTRWE